MHLTGDSADPLKRLYSATELFRQYSILSLFASFVPGKENYLESMRKSNTLPWDRGGGLCLIYQQRFETSNPPSHVTFGRNKAWGLGRRFSEVFAT